MADRNTLIEKMGYWMRRVDVTGDWEGFVDQVLQPVYEMMLAILDRYKSVHDVEKVDVDDVVDAMLFGLNNPFDVSMLTSAQKRLLVMGLVEMYRRFGTDDSIEEVVEIFTSVGVTNIIRGEVENTWELGVQVIGDGVHPLAFDTPTDFIVLNPTPEFLIYSFMLELDSVPTTVEEEIIVKLMRIVKPVYMHYLGIKGVAPTVVVLDWEIGMSEIGFTSDVHG